MPSMIMSLPESLKDFVDNQTAKGPHSSASEYGSELIREDEKRTAEEQLNTMLLEGLQGDEKELTRGDWVVIRQEALAQLKARNQSR